MAAADPPVVQCRANTYKVNGKSEFADFELKLRKSTRLFLPNQPRDACVRCITVESFFFVQNFV